MSKKVKNTLLEGLSHSRTSSNSKNRTRIAELGEPAKVESQELNSLTPTVAMSPSTSQDMPMKPLQRVIIDPKVDALRFERIVLCDTGQRPS